MQFFADLKQHKRFIAHQESQKILIKRRQECVFQKEKFDLFTYLKKSLYLEVGFERKFPVTRKIHFILPKMTNSEHQQLSQTIRADDEKN